MAEQERIEKIIHQPTVEELISYKNTSRNIVFLNIGSLVINTIGFVSMLTNPDIVWGTIIFEAMLAIHFGSKLISDDWLKPHKNTIKWIEFQKFLGDD